MRIRILLPVVLAAFLTSLGYAQEQNTLPLGEEFFLGSIPVTVLERALEKETPHVSMNISEYKGEKFGEISARHKGYVVKDGVIEFDGLSYPESKDKANRQYKRASFVIDYSEKVFLKIAEEIKEKYGSKPTVLQLSEYVDLFINNKSLGRGFDIASQVATKREGDCSEHAVLLVALLRLFGFAARTVFGIVIVEEQGKVMAVGHAWVEYRHKRMWHLADAALLQTEDTPQDFKLHGYIPIRVMKREDPGYGAEMLAGLGLNHVESVEIK